MKGRLEFTEILMSNLNQTETSMFKDLVRIYSKHSAYWYAKKKEDGIYILLWADKHEKAPTLEYLMKLKSRGWDI